MRAVLSLIALVHMADKHFHVAITNAGDLAGFIKAAASSGRPLPEGTIWQIFLQLCQGMQAVHDTCVIHRDIKPANIFMCPDNIVKVGARERGKS